MINLQINVPEKGKDKWTAVAHSGRVFKFSLHDLTKVRHAINKYKKGAWEYVEDEKCIYFKSQPGGDVVDRSIENMMVGFIKKVHPSMSRRGITARFNTYPIRY
jgi:hypothetical protein